MIGYITSLYALAAATLVIAGQDELVKCTPGEYKIIGKADFTGYYLCVFGNPMEMPPCPPGSVFSSNANVCVPKGSTFDDCKKAIDGGGGHMTASPDQGQYKSNKCRTSLCTPCNIRFPSCEGKRDGINVHPVRLWTLIYAVCYKERTVKQDQCQAEVNGRAQLFHPEKNECVSLDMIPREHGGMMPECGTNVDGEGNTLARSNVLKEKCSMIREVDASRKKKGVDPVENSTIAKQVASMMVVVNTKYEARKRQDHHKL
ncbi:hypothetical protein MAR_012878 [Mya arenaria]|uniref:Chitin-binding type-2 domain-containing protein n=1 Tax=Mya arenaria TaxID=6604 RepID=A0ABY7G1A9_MYAAR|nr:hypothetical protein MAR_012878 [Mya arenaria]